LLDSYLAGDLQVPENTLKNALIHCCQEQPQILLL
jgi:hypothetical protein